MAATEPVSLSTISTLVPTLDLCSIETNEYVDPSELPENIVQGWQSGGLYRTPLLLWRKLRKMSVPEELSLLASVRERVTLALGAILAVIKPVSALEVPTVRFGSNGSCSMGQEIHTTPNPFHGVIWQAYSNLAARVLVDLTQPEPVTQEDLTEETDRPDCTTAPLLIPLVNALNPLSCRCVPRPQPKGCGSTASYKMIDTWTTPIYKMNEGPGFIFPMEQFRARLETWSNCGCNYMKLTPETPSAIPIIGVFPKGIEYFTGDKWTCLDGPAKEGRRTRYGVMSFNTGTPLYMRCNTNEACANTKGGEYMSCGCPGGMKHQHLNSCCLYR